ncbi:cytochrome c3 family protein [Aromatoleum diolicum]|uniref:Doubled CXXCH motif domain-containing protein n=1 Tax=Aromatoleum diolicum TaxID=75796 RepID=A0ABX1QIW3_9RHOO|nr:cytochrome c3 family protein [Aromatoleum diolicum]NMG77066.1 hypothetical protein [Aromatoleum diolicum]
MRAKGIVRGVLAGVPAFWVALALAAGPDCRDCHGGAERPPGAGDYSAYYANPARHHPVGVTQPGPDHPAYRQPGAELEGIAFFDSNGNGSLDAEEVRLSDAGTVECYSCHREHGGDEPPAASPATYLRVSERDSALCMICHRI